MKEKIILRLTFLLWFISSLEFTSAQDERHYTCYKASEKITIDGLLSEPSWNVCEWSDDFVDITGNPELKPAFQTRIKMLWDESYLYVAAELQEPHIWATIRKRDEVIFVDNDFEIFLDPEGNGINYGEIEVNAFGTLWDLMLTRAYKDGGMPLTDWNLDNLKTAIHVKGKINDPAGTDTSWTVEMAIPLEELLQGRGSGSKPADGVQWRVNFSRVEWKTEISGSSYHKVTNADTGKPLPEDNWVWSPMGEVSMHIPEHWGRLEFSGEKISSPAPIFSNEKQKKDFKIWVWMGGHDDCGSECWDSMLTQLQKAGVYGILTQASPSTLSRILPLATSHGITVEKWFIAMMNNESALLKTHPDWYVVNREGKSSVTNPAYVGYYRFMCPSNPEVQDYLKTRLEEYLNITGLAGIHLDYIRYPDVILPEALWKKYGTVQYREYAPYDYCYCAICRKKYRQSGGIDPLNLEYPENDAGWKQYRYDQLSDLVKMLADNCHRYGKKLSAAVFPGPSIARRLVRQDWNRWPLDEVMPMLYQNFYYGNLGWIGNETAEGVKCLDPAKPLFSGLYIPSLNPRELQTAVRNCAAAGASGICLFNYESMTARHWKALGELLQIAR